MTPSDGVERVTRLERLRELEPLLDDLFWRDPEATPFQSPAWLLPWVECLAAGAELCFLVVYAGGRAVIALPLMICERGRGEDEGGNVNANANVNANGTATANANVNGTANASANGTLNANANANGERVLTWIGQGISDRLDAIVDPAAPPLALERARRALAELGSEVERIDLDELPRRNPGHDLWRAFEGIEGIGMQPGAVCPVLPLARDLADIERALPASLRRNLAQTERRLAALGHPEWRRARAGEGTAALTAFIDLHTARWRARGGEGVLADASVRAFHHAAAPRLLARGLLVLDLLYLDQAPIAASYVLERADAHLYLFGFDPHLPRLSLGSLAIWRSLRRASDAGRPRYDFLRGAEPYKYAFGAVNSRSYRCAGVCR